MTRFNGKVAIVTGSTQGLGEGIATRLAREGARVVLNGRSREKGKAVQARLHALGAEALFVQADLSKKNEALSVIDAAVAHFWTAGFLDQ